MGRRRLRCELVVDVVEDQKMVMGLSGFLLPALWGLALGGSPSVQIGKSVPPLDTFKKKHLHLHFLASWRSGGAETENGFEFYLLRSDPLDNTIKRTFLFIGKV